ncbi:dihydrofolate reductase [Luteibacter jiangsuensis]|jgi:dihydrofolate reductase
MAVHLVAALDENFAIGKKGGLPWHLPDDLRYFKKLTKDRAVLMGRKTAESIGKPLPDRDNYVLTRKGEAPYPGQITVRSIQEAQARCGHTGVMVIGGGEVFREALPLASTLYLTWVYASVDGADVFFPGIDFKDWTEVSRVRHKADSEHPYAFDMVEYVRNHAVERERPLPGVASDSHRTP